MNRFFKEAILWVILLLPYLYLAVSWDHIPARVPTHFGISGAPDDWSAKSSLLYMPAVIGLLMYFLMLVIPYLDPKKKIQQMGEKYYYLRFALSLFFSLLSACLIYFSIAGTMEKNNFLFALIGAMFAVFGNYFQVLRPNYFIGIRTPWTLENEEIWKKTHRLGGRIWLAGGLLIVIMSFIFTAGLFFVIVFGCILTVLTLVPIIYSYLEFVKLKKMQVE